MALFLLDRGLTFWGGRSNILVLTEGAHSSEEHLDADSLPRAPGSPVELDQREDQTHHYFERGMALHAL